MSKINTQPSAAISSSVDPNFISSSALKLKYVYTTKKAPIVDISTISYIDIPSSEEIVTDRKELPQYSIIIDTDILKSIIKPFAGFRSARINT